MPVGDKRRRRGCNVRSSPAERSQPGRVGPGQRTPLVHAAPVDPAHRRQREQVLTVPGAPRLECHRPPTLMTGSVQPYQFDGAATGRSASGRASRPTVHSGRRRGTEVDHQPAPVLVYRRPPVGRLEGQPTAHTCAPTAPTLGRWETVAQLQPAPTPLQPDAAPVANLQTDVVATGPGIPIGSIPLGDVLEEHDDVRGRRPLSEPPPLEGDRAARAARVAGELGPPMTGVVSSGGWSHRAGQRRRRRDKTSAPTANAATTASLTTR